ncbi:hypothetical protein AAFO92_07525 [Roseovarius sp. CAU 1744]|uniref:hypothetical protein n=1 Tax=Roseovarius sp. CAU 1744 TaxID=3140368 RepID=UPI00325ABE5C
MSKVTPYPVPPGTALNAYAQKPGYYTDCFAVEVDGTVDFADYVEAFYTTPIFKAERLVLRVFAGLRSSDLDARQLALGKLDRFAAWQVAERSDRQLLMKAIGRTSSWFMTQDCGTADGPRTRLLFGSVVAPKGPDGAAQPAMGPLFTALLGAHRVYSRLLLAAARRRILSFRR